MRLTIKDARGRHLFPVPVVTLEQDSLLRPYKGHRSLEVQVGFFPGSVALDFENLVDLLDRPNGAINKTVLGICAIGNQATVFARRSTNHFRNFGSLK
jgi:hypothetical protein